MCDVKDPNFKLFGKTIIGLTETCLTAVDQSESDGKTCLSHSSIELDQDFVGDVEKQESDKSQLSPKQTDGKEDSQKSEESKESNENSQSKTLSNTSDTEAVGTLKTQEEEEEEPDTSNSQDKPLKKPDKIVPCPRCKSMETKFCYFNNYNVNQPRHFCKKCQRYWTAGGTMRNVPVGAGRRKNKHAASQFHLPEALANGIHLNPNGTVLAFNSDATLTNSTASSLNIADKTIQNGVHQPEELNISVSHRNNESKDDHSITISKDETVKSDTTPHFHPFPQLVPCFPGAPWPYPWNYTSSISPTASGNPGFPIPFYPTGGPYYCPMPSPWAVPWLIPPPTSGPVPPTSSLNTPTLGKHSREDIMKGDDSRREGNSEKSLWVPKTLRIGDPIEAAKSSIWETLGIKNERANMVGGCGGIFKAFGSQSKGDEKMHDQEASKILQANPAALCRSTNFRERF